MLARQIASLLIILLPRCVYAQQADFQTFLSEFKESERIEMASFGEPYDFINNEERFAKFLPQSNDSCHCESENIRWQKGSYIKCKNFIVVMLQRYCTEYQDGNSQWFMENDGTDYMLITYSYDGEIIDYKKVGHFGPANPLGMTPAKNGLGMIMEQRLLEDCSLLSQYKNLEYTIYKHKYTLKSDGHIVEKSIGAPQKEIVEVMSLVKQFSFEQFLCYFKKSDTTNIDYTLFRPSENRKELPFESCLSLIPGTLDNNCWPRDIRWLPYKYIENEKNYLFFIIKECTTPKAGFFPYTDYMVLEFTKNGTFKCAQIIYHLNDGEDVDDEKITKALNVYLAEKQSK